MLPGPAPPSRRSWHRASPASWRFVGFLPRAGRSGGAARARTETLVAFESPRRLPATLELIAGAEPGRPLAVCRELTKIHEEVRRGAAAELAEHYREPPARGEIVLVCGAAGPGRARLEEAMAGCASSSRPAPGAAGRRRRRPADGTVGQRALRALVADQ